MELFRTEVNDEGKRLLQRFGRLSLAALVFALLISGAQTASFIYSFQKALRFATESKVRQGYLLSIGFGVLNFVLQVVQVVFYRRFASVAVGAVERSDSEAFNRSFRFLIMQAVCFLAQLILMALFMLTRFAILL